MEKCCSMECMALQIGRWTRNWRYGPTRVTHARLRGDLLYHPTVSAKRKRCKKIFCWTFCAARRTKECRFQPLVGAGQEIGAMARHV